MFLLIIIKMKFGRKAFVCSWEGFKFIYLIQYSGKMKLSII